MGICMSRVPAFTDAPKDLADGLLPESLVEGPTGTSTLIPIRLIPQQELSGAAIAVYLPTDTHLPSYFFAPYEGSFHLFKIVRTPDEELDREIVASIISDGQTSQGGYKQVEVDCVT